MFQELPVLENSVLENSKITNTAAVARPLPPSRAAQIGASQKPPWLKIRPPAGPEYLKIKSLVQSKRLHTVCAEAHCPNVAECWASGTATLMLGGDTCTRACRFCAVKTARRPPPLDPEEPEKTAESVAAMGLRYVVLTSVDRDDLPDGGASHFAEAVRAIKRRDPRILVEALMPDFRGDRDAVSTVALSGLDVYAHNVETVRRLQYRVRDPRAGFMQSLMTLRLAKECAEANGISLLTKSSLLLGFGEEEQELKEAFRSLRAHGVDVLTLGQYLRPSMKHLPVEKYVTPEEFKRLQLEAEKLGFLFVASGPLVRSSYRAGEFFMKRMIEKRGKNATQTA